MNTTDNMDAREFLCNKVARPKWFLGDMEHTAYDTWSYGHSAAPWELDLTSDEWGRLTEQSDYFHTIQQGRVFSLPKRLCSTDGMELEDGFQYNLTVPLYSNSAINDVVSSHCPNSVRHFGNRMEFLPDRLQWPRRFKPTIAVHMEHLLMGILVIVWYKSMSSPFDDIISANIMSFLHVTRFLGAPYLLQHMAKHVVTDYTLTHFKTQLRTLLSPSEENYEFLMNIIKFQNERVYRDGFDFESFQIIHEMGLPPSKQILMGRRKWFRIYCEFWEHQSFTNCAVCNKVLLNMRVNSYESHVDILECCLNLICKACLTNVLWNSHRCKHVPRCLTLDVCFCKTNPFRVLQMGVSSCPQCGAGYRRGFWKWVYTERRYIKSIKRARWANRYNEHMLLGANRIYYISPMLRDLVNVLYPFTGCVTLDPNREPAD